MLSFTSVSPFFKCHLLKSLAVYHSNNGFKGVA
uniref:Uncharacterized protein n=1 Tax=Arundo donax TaxID=35708 RepID=A0A0A9BII5_ARUDO